MFNLLLMLATRLVFTLLLLLSAPFLQILYLLQLTLLSFGINLILDSVLFNLLLHPLMLVMLKGGLTHSELHLLLL